MRRSLAQPPADTAHGTTEKRTGRKRRRIRAPVLTAGMVLTLTAAVAPAVSAAPRSVPPLAAQGGQASPGQLLSAQPFSAHSYPDTRAWRITYRSTTSTGQPDTVSGAVIAPATASARTPIVGYAPGTLGLGDQCAQSKNLEAGQPGEESFIQLYTSQGYAVAITDYEGLGTPGEHTYTAGRSEGQATLDVVRAAQRLPGSNLSPGAPVALVGYSQGGLATGWAAQLAPTYAPEINLKGAAVGDPPADLNANVAYLDGTTYFGLELATIYGQNAAHPNLHLERYLNAKGRAAFKEIGTECDNELVIKTGGSVTKWAGHTLSEYTTTDFLNRPDWRAALRQSSPGSLTPKVPVLLYNSPADDIVPFAATAKLRQTWCSHHADITFYAPDTGGHGTTGYAMAPVAAGWIMARLIGLPAQSNC